MISQDFRASRYIPSRLVFLLETLMQFHQGAALEYLSEVLYSRRTGSVRHRREKREETVQGQSLEPPRDAYRQKESYDFTIQSSLESRRC